MCVDYHRPVRAGKLIFGKMGYNAVIEQIMECMECTFDQAKIFFGQMGNAAYVDKIMREYGCTYEEVKKNISHKCYDATMIAIMGFFGCTFVMAQTIFDRKGAAVSNSTNPGLARGAHTSIGKGETPKGKITPLGSERSRMISEETRRNNALKIAMTMFRSGSSTFDSMLHEFSQLGRRFSKTQNKCIHV
jgi:hypothetical protein